MSLFVTCSLLLLTQRFNSPIWFHIKMKPSIKEQIGRILHVNLSTGKCTFKDFFEEAFEYLGGRGFNIWYLYKNLLLGTHPLSKENILMFSCGLLTGSAAPSASRLHINSLSPLTNILGSSNIGGYAGAWLRSCDILSIIITGKAKKPVFLYVDTLKPCLKEASSLWGLDTFETQQNIQKSYPDEKLRVFAIGPAGENKVFFAAIVTEKDHAAGRTGMGAVMGSKNLKAIAIKKGSYKPFYSGFDVQKKAVKDYTRKIRDSVEFDFFSKYGGAGYVKWVNDFGIMGSKNYKKIGIDDIEKIDGRQIKKNVVKVSGCFKCPVQCKADIKIENANEVFTRPEFEPIINFGPKCGLNDINQIIKLDNLCQRLGIDCVSTASVIAFAMDLFEQKILPDEFMKNLDLSWGNAETMEKLIHQIVEDKGLGKILRLGIKKAAKIIQNGADKYATHVKGLELTAYHPTAIMGTALGYVVSSRGGDYNNVYASLEYSWDEILATKEFGTKKAVNIKSITAKGALVKKAVISNIIADTIGICKVPVFSLLKSFNLEDETKLMNVLTGLNISNKDLINTGKKIADLERLFNIKHNAKSVEDKLPSMFFVKDKTFTKQRFESMLCEYYEVMGWDKDGIPSDPLINKT